MTGSQGGEDWRLRLAYGGIFGLAILVGWQITATWAGTHYGIRSAACVLGAALVLLVELPGSGWATPRRITSALLVAWCGAVLSWTLARPLAELPSGDDPQAWSVFHYYLGAKYFPELGYTGLYEQAMAADQDGPKNWPYVTRIRNLETYEVERVGDMRRRRTERFTDARWQEFQADLEFLGPYLSRRDWRRVLRDRGYNPPPPSTALRRALTSFDLSTRSLAIVGSLDAIGLLAAFTIVGFVFGPLRALVGLTWLALFFGNAGERLVGQPFLYDYLIALLLAACALKGKRPALAGVLLAYAAMMRVFPVLLLGGLAWWWIMDWRRTRTVSRLALRFAIAFALTAALLAIVGLGNGRGIEGWREFVSNLAHHSEQHIVGERRIGLPHLFSVDWTNPPPGEQGRTERFESWARQEGTWQVVAVGVGVLWLWATARRRLHLFDTIFAALLLVFCGVVLSRYYWSAACLLLLTGGHNRDGPLGGRGPALVAAALLAWSGAVYAYSAAVTENLHRYLFANLVALVLLVGGLGLMAFGGSRARRRGS